MMKALFIVSLLYSMQALAQQVDHLSLASLLLKNGHLSRAKSSLADYSNSGIKDRRRYNLLLGLYYLKKKQFKKALITLGKSESSGEKSPFLTVYKAQANYFLGEYQTTLELLDKLDLKKLNIAKLVILKSKSYWKQGQYDKAFETLDFGDREFNSYIFEKTRISYFLEEKLFVEAFERSLQFLVNQEAPASEYINLALNFQISGAKNEGRLVLELANLKHPYHGEVLNQLAKSYYQSGKLLAAATLFEHSSLANPDNRIYAIDLFRKLGLFSRANFLETQIVSHKERDRQKFISALEQKKFHYMPILYQRLRNNETLSDELKYAMAYGLMRSGELRKSKRLLSKIIDERYLNKAVQMRKLIQECIDKKWECDENI